jgi:hypothetical protein
MFMAFGFDEWAGNRCLGQPPAAVLVSSHVFLLPHQLPCLIIIIIIKLPN